jgi:hypothetical protein
MGWLVDVIEKTGKWIKIKDCYGLFDLIAINNRAVSLIQVASNSPHPHKYMMAFKAKYPIVHVVQYVKMDRAGIVCYYYHKDCYTKEDCEVKKNGKKESC